MPFPMTPPKPPSWSISQEEWTKALEIAERWKHRVPEPFTTTVSGAIAEEMGLLSRALLHCKGCYDTLRAAHED